jgi:hypothetical protein
MHRMIPMVLLGALGACAANVEVADTLFVQPGKFHFLRCQDIAQRSAGLAARERELSSLMERASQSAAGPIINATVYAADLEQVRADQRLLWRTAQEKNCEALKASGAPDAPAPAPAPAPPAPARAR